PHCRGILQAAGGGAQQLRQPVEVLRAGGGLAALPFGHRLAAHPKAPGHHLLRHAPGLPLLPHALSQRHCPHHVPNYKGRRLPCPPTIRQPAVAAAKKCPLLPQTLPSSPPSGMIRSAESITLKTKEFYCV